MNILSTIGKVSEQIADNVNLRKKTLVYIGRFCPMHFGHQAIIGGIVRASPDKHLILVGSCNQPTSYRNLFGFSDRIDFIRQVFPDVKIAGLPDFPGDNVSWFTSLNCLIKLSGTDPDDVVFVGGCEEDVQWFKDNNREVIIINRFSGLTTNISGTEIRDHLITGNQEKLANVLDPSIIDMVVECFQPQWEKLRRQ